MALIAERGALGVNDGADGTVELFCAEVTPKFATLVPLYRRKRSPWPDGAGGVDGAVERRSLNGGRHRLWVHSRRRESVMDAVVQESWPLGKEAAERRCQR